MELSQANLNLQECILHDHIYNVVVMLIIVVVFFDVSPTREQSPRKAVHMARGNINPITLEVMDQFSPSKVGGTFMLPWQW